MPPTAAILDELVTANRILAREGVVDAFGHVSIRHPERPDRFCLSRARAPECIEAEDIMEFAIDGRPIDPGGRKPYAERFIHAAVYEARADVQAVVHNHSPAVIPFGITGTRLRPVMHMCASMGTDVPIWDSRRQFGDTNLLVTAMPMARDLAAALGDRAVALMRGHGCVVAGGSLRVPHRSTLPSGALVSGRHRCHRGRRGRGATTRTRERAWLNRAAPADSLRRSPAAVWLPVSCWAPARSGWPNRPRNRLRWDRRWQSSAKPYASGRPVTSRRVAK